MAFPLLKLLPSLLRTIGKITGLPLGDAATALEGAKLTPEQQLALQESLERHEQAMKALSVDEMKTAISESLAMIQSEDKFVKHARPSMLYAATAITVALCIAVGVAILKASPIDLGTIGAITSLMVPLWGASGYYVGKRSEEKIAGMQNGNGNT